MVLKRSLLALLILSLGSEVVMAGKPKVIKPEEAAEHRYKTSAERKKKEKKRKKSAKARNVEPSNKRFNMTTKGSKNQDGHDLSWQAAKPKSQKAAK